jgi:DHA1 family bicyclomycin/chloramphenicol resistance-like MFS transporter
MLAVCCWRLPETHPPSARQPFSPALLARNYVHLASNGRMLLLSLAIALNFSGFFLYISSAPAFIYNLVKLGATEFAWLFVPGIAGVMIGAYLSGRTAGRLTPQRTVQMGYVIMFGAVLANIAHSALAEPAVPWSVLPVMCYTAGMALAMPSIMLLALDLFPKNRGLASSLLGFGHSAFTALTAGLISPLLSGSTLTLALGMAGLLSCGCLSWLTYWRIETRSARAEHAR